MVCSPLYKKLIRAHTGEAEKNPERSTEQKMQCYRGGSAFGCPKIVLSYAPSIMLIALVGRLMTAVYSEAPSFLAAERVILGFFVYFYTMRHKSALYCYCQAALK